jgi:hypothetical protein
MRSCVHADALVERRVLGRVVNEDQYAAELSGREGSLDQHALVALNGFWQMCGCPRSCRLPASWAANVLV